ncbi:MAG TPA: FAD-dependent monooxygenase [Vicinamibacterales bacterium]|nr:FAD-dependent monooxygenase [Vicinamibacterales bacterium]
MISRVVIAGGGIGGLTLAAALRRRGVHVTVLERAAELRPVGAGLALGPNAMMALARIGLAQPAAAAGVAIERSVILDAGGRPLGFEVDVADLSRELGHGIVALHRTRLHDVLLDAVGRDQVRTNTRVIRYDMRSDGVEATCQDGASVAGDLLVAADGLHSTLRAQMVGDGAPRYAGYTSWRGVTPPGSVAPPVRLSESWGRGERFGIVNIGFGEIYWFAVADAPASGQDSHVKEELLDRFAGWHAPIAEIIEATPADRILRTDISDRDPIRRWHEGHVVLLGDAAHPMTPNLGQGAGQAIEDAIVLDHCLSAHVALEGALRAYEQRRVARANWMVLGSRRLGAVAQLRNPVAAWLRDAALRMTPPSVALTQARKLMQVDFDA